MPKCKDCFFQWYISRSIIKGHEGYDCCQFDKDAQIDGNQEACEKFKRLI